eukprot:Opistho-2@78082
MPHSHASSNYGSPASHRSRESTGSEWTSSAAVFVNGRKYLLEGIDPEESLLTFLRTKARLTGTKLGCGEGGCGACTVMISRYDAEAKSVVHRAINACLAPLASVAGMAVTTVEGIGSTATRLHPVQQRIAEGHGSQCGFCTPGIVMSMYTLLRNTPTPSRADLDHAFEGNLCRCTGYRPILQAFTPFVRQSATGCPMGDACCRNNAGSKAVEPAQTPESSSHAHTHVHAEAGGDKCENAGCGEGVTGSPIDPTQEPIFPPELVVSAATHLQPLRFIGPRCTWYRPASLADLLSLKAAHPHARIVVGNTEVGIEMKFKRATYPVLIAGTHVPELQMMRVSQEGTVCIGASVPLADVGVRLQKEVASRPESQTRALRAILEGLRWFAGPQIRNAGCIAGNIATASPISDLNPVLVATNSTVRLASSTGGVRDIPLDGFFVGYRKTAMRPDEVIVSVTIPPTKENEYVETFKQARRKEDDIAIVNACMRVVVTTAQGDAPVVRECALAFGGMGPTVVRAKTTESALVGKKWSTGLVDVATDAMASELSLSDDVPGGMPEYRQALAASFFFKFFSMVSLHIMPSVVDARDLSVCERSHRPPSHGVQVSKSPADAPERAPVGESMAHLSAAKQATGEAIYVDDISPLSNELHAAIVISERAHADILSVDASLAVALPGVHAFVSAADVRGHNDIGPVVHDEEVFATKKVVCVGSVIGIVVADTQARAHEAARLVKVAYIDLPAVLTIEDAIAANSFFEPTRTIVSGDVAAAFTTCDGIVEGEVRMGGQEHFYLETQATLAVPGEDGEMELFVSTQAPTKTQMTVAHVLGVPANRVVCRVKRMGGGFGGKETRNVFLTAAAAVAARRLGRPVRLVLDRDMDMQVTGGRHPFHGRYKVGYMADGRIAALQLEMFSNGGYSYDLSLPVMERALFHLDNAYRIPNVHATGRVCRTNLASNTAFRGFGGPQGMFICETWMSHVADALGLSQNLVRERNLYKDGDRVHYNQDITDCHAERCFVSVRESASFQERAANVAEFNASNRWRKRGLAVIPTKFGISFTAKFMNQAGALVHMYADGSVLVTHGGTEMGQGLHTKMLQVAARELGVPMDAVHISETSTATVPNTSPTAASASSDLNGMAIQVACQTIRERLEPYRAANPSGSVANWAWAAYFDRVSLSATGFYATPDLGYDFATNSGKAFHYYTYGAACSEVEIDVLTGDHAVLRSDIVMDVGHSLNPALDIGQVEGAFVQGQGLFTLEELVYLRSGHLFTRGPGTYKLPGFADIPTDMRVTLLPDAPNPHAIHSSKAVGEPPLFLAASVFFAVREAIKAARLENGEASPFVLDSPATAERIRMACTDRFIARYDAPRPGKAPKNSRWGVVA